MVWEADAKLEDRKDRVESAQGIGFVSVGSGALLLDGSEFGGEGCALVMMGSLIWMRPIILIRGREIGICWVSV